MTYVWIALGGALGSVARHWCTTAIDDHLNAGFPWGTIGVNALGSLIIGIVAALAADGSRAPLSQQAIIFLAVGLCGGFTTFSAFSLQTFAMLRDGLLLRAAGNITLSVALCLVATAAGYLLIRQINA